MIKRIIWLVVALILSFPTPILAAEPDSGTIEGRIVNGSVNGSSVAGVDIALEIYQKDTQAGSASAKADAEGRFVFNNLSLDSDYSYRVTLTYQEAEYTSEWLSFSEGESSKSVEVTVYDATASDEAIRVATSHTVIYVGLGSLEVVEYFLFVNEADRAYVGSKVVTSDGKKETLRFPLPKNATETTPDYGLMECCIVGSEEGFSDTMAVLPGGKEIVYSYMIGYDSGAYTLAKKIDYPIASLDFLVQGESIEVASDRLQAKELVTIEGTPFSHYSGENFNAGDTLVVKLSGLPKSGSQGPILWVALTLAALTVGFVLIYRQKRRRLQPVSPRESLEQRRRRLLVEIAELDDDFEGGKIAEGVYRQLRAETKRHLVELKRGAK